MPALQKMGLKTETPRLNRGAVLNKKSIAQHLIVSKENPVWGGGQFAMAASQASQLGRVVF